MTQARMRLKVLLPFQIFTEVTNVSRIVIETHDGSFGLLPHRLDCVAGLKPGILMYANDTDRFIYVAIDQGVIVKYGLDVLISVRRAYSATDLGQLRNSIERDFLTLDQTELSTRLVMAKLESGFLRRFASFGHE